MIFAANIFGAGSVYILTTTGANYGFSLLWVLPLSLAVGLAVHEMAARLAVQDEPLMEYIRDVIGPTPSKAFALFIAFIMQFWSVANFAVAGAALAFLTPLDNILVGTVLMGATGLALVELRVYQRIEGAIAVVVLAVFGSYCLIFLGLDVPVGDVAAGLVPALQTEFGFLTMIIALVGTTIYYPNFFIQSSMHHAKEFDSISRYRSDHTVGLAAAIVMSMAVMVVAAITVPSGVTTLTDPAGPLVDEAGAWALVVFVVGAGAASFSSATGTLFGAGFMVPQAFGHDTRFGDRPFRLTVNGLIALSVVIAVPLLAYTGFTAVQMAILMPAVNGAIGLPVTVLALYYAVQRYADVSRGERVVFAVAVVLMFAAAALTMDSLAASILQFA